MAKMSQTQSKDKTVIIAAIIAGVFGCVAAAIGLGSPIIKNLADRYIPTFTPAPSNTSPTSSDIVQGQEPVQPTFTSITPAESPFVLPTPIPPTPTPNKCQWLQSNFPQTADDAKAKYYLPSDTTFQFIHELCPYIANAFAFKANSVVEIQVPSGGCIDSWSGFTAYVGDVGTPVEDGHGGWRVYKGSVRAPEMTIRILGCQ